MREKKLDVYPRYEDDGYYVGGPSEPHALWFFFFRIFFFLFGLWVLTKVGDLIYHWLDLGP